MVRTNCNILINVYFMLNLHVNACICVEGDIENIKASVDEAKLDVRSAAQKFAEMDRKAGANRLPILLHQNSLNWLLTPL